MVGCRHGTDYILCTKFYMSLLALWYVEILHNRRGDRAVDIDIPSFSSKVAQILRPHDYDVVLCVVARMLRRARDRED
jgi:hypothetical protein